MAIRTRQTKAGPVHWVVTRGSWEKVGDGHDRREAERLNARRKKELKSGVFVPRASTGAMTVGKFLDTWLAARSNRSAGQETMMLETHVLVREWFRSLRLDDLDVPHVQRLVEEIGGGALAPRYVSNIYGALRVALRAAYRRGYIRRDVCQLDPGTISRKIVRDVQPYSLNDARALLASAVGARRAWLALAFYTGMRCGEVNGRRWGDWDRTVSPLGCITIRSQYDGEPLKTDQPRRAPVHLELAVELERWLAEYELATLRKPDPGALIVPGRTGRAMTRGGTYKALDRDCERAGVTPRGQHATRHTFLTQARRGGASKDIIERVTHNAEGEMVDHYTHWEWEPLCEAVLCLPSFVGRPTGIANETSQNQAPTQGLEPSLHEENRANTQKLLESSNVENSEITAVSPREGAELGASPTAEVWALAFAAERVLSRRVVTVTSISRRGRKGVA